MIHRRWRRALADGSNLHADVRVPEGASPRAAVLLLHGFKGFKDWGFFPWLAEQIVHAGIATVVPDFSLNGVAEGGGEFDDLESFARNTFTREQDDLSLLMEALLTGDLLSVPPTRIGLFGHSRGGGQAILAAHRHPVDALVTWAAVSTFHRWSASEQAKWRQEGRIHIMNQRTGQAMPLDRTLLDDLEAHAASLDIEAAAREARIPWLLIHGEADAAVPSTEGQRLAHLNPGARTLFLPHAGHTFEATHPMGGVPAALQAAAKATVSHFSRFLLDES